MYFFHFFFFIVFHYYFNGSLAELKLSRGNQGGLNKDKILSVYYGLSFKYLIVFLLIFYSITFQTLIEYGNTETLLLSSFILVFFIIVFIVSDGFFDFRGDFFFNTLDTFAFSYKLRSLKVNKLRLSYFYNNLNLFYKLNAFIFVLGFFRKFDLNKDFLFEEDASIFHNFFSFDFHRSITNNTNWWRR